MKVTITVGSVTRELEIRDDLLDVYRSDERQNIVMGRVGAAFVDAYAEEVRRAKEATRRSPVSE